MLVQREPVSQAAAVRSRRGAFQRVRADVDAVRVPVGALGEGLYSPDRLPTAQIQDAGRRLPARPAQ
jgi:hypothetical protein